MADSVTSTAARSLRELVRTAPGRPLPSLRTLARKWTIGYDSLLRAARRLRAEGVIEFGRGSAIRPKVRTEMAPTPKVPAAEELFQRVRAEIEGRLYRPGDSLPKRAWVAAQRKASINTVSRAYGMLVSSGYVHREGRRWVVSAPLRARSGSQRTVLVVIPWHGHFEAICTSSRTADFGRTFVDLARHHDTRLVPVYMNDDTHGRARGELIGRQAALRLLDHPLRGCLGALMTATRRERGEQKRWLEEMAATGKPVVWFDRSGEGVDGHLPRGVTRVAYCEQAMCKAALDHLRGLGHRTVAFLHDPAIPWHVDRLRHLRGAADESGGPKVIALPEHERTRWFDRSLIMEDFAALDRLSLPNVNQALRFLARNRESWTSAAPPEPATGPGHAWEQVLAYSIRRFSRREDAAEYSLETQAREIWTGMHLAPLLGRPDITAVLFANDRAGRPYHDWLVRARIQCPAALSVLGFDNSTPYAFPTLSSVDPGFDVLGYKAFHILAGDTAAVAQPTGTVAIRPLIADYGSTGSAREFG